MLCSNFACIMTKLYRIPKLDYSITSAPYTQENRSEIDGEFMLQEDRLVDRGGKVIEVSCLNLLCFSLSPQEDKAVTGSADHCLYEIDLKSGSKIR